MTSSDDSKLQAQVLPCDAAGGAKDEAAAPSKAPPDASNPVTAPATTSTATAATQSALATPRTASSTSNTSAVTTRTLPAASKTALATTKAAPATNSTVSATTKSEPPAAKSEPPAAKPEPPAAKSEPPAAKSEPPAAKPKPLATKTAPVATPRASEDGSDDPDSLSDSSSDDKSVRTSVENEVFIAVMGQTGAGKSSFINRVTGGELAVGHGLSSCTHEIQTASTIIDKRPVTLIDTPGFDDTSRLEGEILNLIAAFLRNSYNRNELLSGAIYLHRITDNKVGMASRRTMTVLQRICGADNFQNIVLVTTMWDELVDQKVGEDRERELETGSHFWAQMISRKAKIFRHDGKEETAVGIVKQIILKPPVPLVMQVELSSERASVAGTTAGRFITEYLLQQRKLIEENADSIISHSEEATTDLQEITERIDEDISYMQVPVEDLLAQAREAETESEDGGATQDGGATVGDGATEDTSDRPPPRRSFLQKLFDMVRWMDRRETQPRL